MMTRFAIFLLLSAVLAPSPAFSHPGHEHERQVVALRGSSALCPENTLAAFRRALAEGADAVWADVRMTIDGELVLLRDETLDRTTNGRGPLADQSLAQVRALDAGRWKSEDFRGQKVPTLLELLELCRDKSEVWLQPHQADQQLVTALANELKQHARLAQVVIVVQSVEQARAWRAALPTVRQLGYLTNAKQIAPMAAAGVDSLRLELKWLKDFAVLHALLKTQAHLHLDGRTGGAKETLPLLVRQPDSLGTSDPAKLRNTLEEYEAGKLTGRR